MTKLPMTSVQSSREHDDEGYAGPATVIVGGHEIQVSVQLKGYFQPLDGRYTWYGRIARNDELTALLRGAGDAVLVTPQGRAAARLSNIDSWGRYQARGRSTPPFAVATAIPDPDPTAR